MFKQFYSALVETLPMDYTMFITRLITSGLLTFNCRNQMNLQIKSEDKATLFLDSMIKPILTCDGENFLILLKVMEDIFVEEYQGVKELVKSIRASLETINENTFRCKRSQTAFVIKGL